MKERTPEKYDPYGGGCPMLLVEVVAPSIARRIREKAEREWDAYKNKGVKTLEKKLREPEVKEEFNQLLQSYGISHHDEKKVIWSDWKNNAVVSIRFTNPKTMRQIFESPELRPQGFLLSEGRMDDAGLPVRIRFVDERMKDVKVEIIYDNYLWAHGDWVLDSSERLQDFGYEEVGWNESIPPLSKLWRLKLEK